MSIYDAIANERPLWERRLVQGHLGRFGFSGDEVQRTVGTLSGGERARVALALLTLSTNNLLVLDEPTNHLDVESIEALEDAIDAYEGTVLMVSHDRAVLRGLATQVWELRDQKMLPFDGSFVEWEELRAESRAKADKDARAASVAESQRASAARSAALKAEKAKAPSSQKNARQLERQLADAERVVQTLEAEIAALETRLDDPSLYDTPDGVKTAQKLGKALEEARDALDVAMQAWGEAAEAVG
jgi:ATP-binding cassette subfamily F protein 3